MVAPGPEGWCSTLSILGVGLVLGLKHALDADHVAAVCTMVSERRGLWSGPLIGALWGVGHSLALLGAGVAVIVLQLHIGARLAATLELGVALMLIGLGANALWKVARGARVHVHVHEHGRRAHVHLHVHGRSLEHDPLSHHALRLGVRPLLVGMMHGLAGSAALMLVVLSTITSTPLALAYLAVFGIGSIGGMVAMSALIGLPLQLTAGRFARAHVTARMLAGALSLGLGILMAYEIGVAGRLLS